MTYLEKLLSKELVGKLVSIDASANDEINEEVVEVVTEVSVSSFIDCITYIKISLENFREPFYIDNFEFEKLVKIYENE